MKQKYGIKKYLALLLAFCLLAAPATAFAEDAVPVIMGDLDGNGRVTAGDARTALRMSAQLESTEGVDMMRVDTDGNGRVTAGDARTILRYSAKLSGFTRGFNKDGLPCSIDVFASGKYDISMKYEGIVVSVITDGKSIFINGDSSEFDDFNDELAGLFGKFGGIYRVNGKLYFSFIDDAGNISIFTIVSKALLDNMTGENGESFDDYFTEMFNMLPTSVLSGSVKPAGEETVDGKTYSVWSSYDSAYKTTTRFLTEADGTLRKIEVSVDGEDVVSEVDVQSLKGDIPSNMFTITQEQVDEAGAIVTVEYLGGHEIIKL